MKKFYFFILLLFVIKLKATVTVLSTQNPTCAGICNGSIVIQISGGTPSYTVSAISNCGGSGPLITSATTYTITGLCGCSSSYTINVMGSGGFSLGTATATLTAPPPIIITFSVTNVSCYGVCTGSICPNVSGGTPPYNYQWFPAGGTTGPCYSNLCAGSYTLCVTDANACIVCAVTTVSQPPPITVQVNTAPASCPTCCDGTVTAIPAGGAAPYMGSLDGAPFGPGFSWTNVCTGTHTVCVKDANACVSCKTVTVTAGSVGITIAGTEIGTAGLFPNPANDYLFLNVPKAIVISKIEIFDVSGRKVSAANYPAQYINIKNLAEGLYEVKLFNDSDIYRQKIIIRRD